MHHYRIIDTATGDEMGVLAFDPEDGFSVKQAANAQNRKAMNSMAEDLNGLDNFHVTVPESFTRTVSHVYARGDAELPAFIPAIIMERFLLSAMALETNSG